MKLVFGRKVMYRAQGLVWDEPKGIALNFLPDVEYCPVPSIQPARKVRIIVEEVQE